MFVRADRLRYLCRFVSEGLSPRGRRSHIICPSLAIYKNSCLLLALPSSLMAEVDARPGADFVTSGADSVQAAHVSGET